MVREVKDRNLFEKIKITSRNPFFIPIIFLLFLVMTIPVITLITSRPTQVEQQAETVDSTATMTVNPPAGNFIKDQDFTVSLIINGGGQTFNAAKADIEVSPNLTVKSLTITPPASGGCNFTFVNTNKTPKVSDLSFAGAILNASSTGCTLFTVTLAGNAEGVGSIILSRPSVKSYETNREILSTYQNGSYLILTDVISPTSSPTPTLIPSATPTPVIVTPTPTPIPSATPTPVILDVPTFDIYPPQTYKSALTLSGSKASDIVRIFVNSSTLNVTYPSATTWLYQATLSLGVNNFNIYGQNESGVNSPVNSITINLHRLADISGDSVIDITDLSIFGTDWEKTEGFTSVLSDMNEDGTVDLSDFSILAKAYGN